MIAVVGEGIKQSKGLGQNIVKELTSAGVSVKAISEGASDTTVAVVVDNGDVREGLNIVHELCFEKCCLKNDQT